MNRKEENIKYYLSKLYNYKFDGVNSELVDFLLTKNYDRDCGVENKVCEGCIHSWLSWEVKEKLYEENKPFNSYKEVIDFYLEYKDHFEIGMGYQMRDGYSLSPYPSNEEESQIFTPHIEEFYKNRRRSEIEEGGNTFSKFPITTYEKLSKNYFRKIVDSPIPDKFLQNEIAGIEKLVSESTPSIKNSFEREYDAIVNCEKLLFDWNKGSDPTLRFYLRSITYPIVKYKVFLDSQGGVVNTVFDLDTDLKQIEIKLRNIIKTQLNIDSIKVLKQNFNGEIVKKIEELIRREKSKDPHGTNKREIQINYWLELTDLGELKQIICQKNNWMKFADVFGSNKQKFSSEFEDLINLRNPIRHAREIKKTVALKGEAAVIWFKEQLTI